MSEYGEKHGRVWRNFETKMLCSFNATTGMCLLSLLIFANLSWRKRSRFALTIPMYALAVVNSLSPHQDGARLHRPRPAFSSCYDVSDDSVHFGRKDDILSRSAPAVDGGPLGRWQLL